MQIHFHYFYYYYYFIISFEIKVVFLFLMDFSNLIFNFHLLAASKALRQTEEQVKVEATASQQTHPHSLNSLQHLGQFPPLMPKNKQPRPQAPIEASQGAPNLSKPPTMSYASALRAPPKSRAVRPEQAKKNSDPLSLLQELSIGSSNGSNGYYSYFK